MPVERRSFSAAKPVKTERTHEENQERAYIAASRRSDRSLEARIESARRASEIHKKRTGRALRVTEQDVINEEMYEEEDDDLPTQYQRLNAHLHTTSVMFNKKLHDYIATQHGVRNMFMSQYQNQSFQPYGMQYPAQTTNWLNPSMPPPQQFTATSPQVFQQPQPYSPTGHPQQGFRQAPYHIPPRSQSHQRSLSIQLPNGTPNFDSSAQHASGGSVTPQGGISRRMSLPPQAFEQQSQTVSGEQAHSGFSRSPSVQSPTSASPSLGVAKETQSQPEIDTPTSYTYSPPTFPQYSQVFNTNPLSLSLPPESQQLIGSALDPNDPRTAVFMSGSNNLPQPFDPAYRYQPNICKPPNTTSGNVAEHSPKSGAGLSIQLENSSGVKPTPPTSISEGFFSTEAFLTPGNGDYNAFFDFQGGDLAPSGDEAAGADQVDVSNFVNWD